MSTTAILPTPSYDTQLRARLRHLFTSYDLTPNAVAVKIGTARSTVIRHVNRELENRRPITGNSVDQYIKGAGSCPDEIFNPRLTSQMRSRLERVAKDEPDAVLPLDGWADEAHAMGLVDVRGKVGEVLTYRLRLTDAGRRALTE